MSGDRELVGVGRSTIEWTTANEDREGKRKNLGGTKFGTVTPQFNNELNLLLIK